MPSGSVPANRELPKSLLRRLEEIAAGNRGHVHLHGRLFLQWMHHAYPRECPFPHVSGTVNASSMGDWLTAEPDRPVAAAATEEEMREHIEKAKQHSSNATSNGTDGESGDCAPWYGHEELLVSLVHEEPAAPQVTPPPSLRAVQSTSSPRSLWIASAVMALMALTTGVVGVVRLVQTPKKADEKLIDLDVVHYV
uniref:Uncharacterized protein n=1 Tax=Alexandrium catenella TaxID=2925 RepID=A0A7S1RUT0_ALECA